MDIGRQMVRRVKGADTNEPNYGPSAGVVTPNGNTTLRTTGDFLPLPTVRRSVDDLRIGAQIHYTIRLNHCIQCKGCATFSLTPPAVTTVHDQWSSFQSVADPAAVATPLHREYIRRQHDCNILRWVVDRIVHSK